jgi:hypothetical protein
MAHALTADELRHQTTLGEDVASWSNRLIGFGLLLLLGSAAYAYARPEENWRQFQFSYHIAFCVFLSISLGALWFVVIHHLVGAKWSTTVRRVAEISMTSFALLFVLFLPTLIAVLKGNAGLFSWMHQATAEHAHDAGAVHGHDLVAGKIGYLNPTFFTARVVLYFAIWIGFARFYSNTSRAQDLTGDPMLTVKMRKLAPVAIILFALSTTFAAFDFLMSLEPEWFSTIFGVYFFAGCALSFFCSTIVISMLIQEKGRLQGVITAEHYHDLGKWSFAFVFFWGYIAFSQFMLIWYANLPEETFWFRDRIEGSWLSIAVFILIGHLLIPFGGLLSRHVKRNKAALAFWAVTLLLMHWVDLYWIAMPALHRGGVAFHPFDATLLLGIGGLFAGFWIKRAQGGLLSPVRDPYFQESLGFRNM